MRVQFKSAFSLLFASAAVLAQVPDAGALRQEIERPALPVPAPPVRPSAPPAAPPAVAGALQVTVRHFEFAGNTRVSSEALATELSDLLDRPLSFAELSSVTTRVAVAYRKAGWIARAILPPQDLQDGVVNLKVIEAVFGHMRLRVGAGEAARINMERLSGMVEAHLTPGQPISAVALDRLLMLLDELPGASVQGSLASGAREGESDLVLVVTGDRLASADVRADNTGSRSTGRERLSLNASLTSPLGWGDVWSTNLLHTEGSDYGRLAYSAAVGNTGWTAGMSATDMRYHLVGAEFAALRASGTSTSMGADLSIPVWRARQLSANAVLSLEQKDFDNRSGDVVTTRYNITSGSLTLNGQAQDDWLGGGRVQASLGAVWGTLDLSNSPNKAADALTARTNGEFRKLRYSLARQQALSDAWTASVSLSGQRASKNLDSAEKFFLGGSSGVRAYPTSEAGGADGDLLNLELSMRLPAGLSVSALHDWGWVQVNQDNQFAGAPANNYLSLRGMGLALNWEPARGVNAKLTWAQRLGSNPNPDANGNDQDGTLIRDRLWLNVGWAL